MAAGGLAPLPLRFATVALIALLCLVAASCVVVFFSIAQFVTVLFHR